MCAAHLQVGLEELVLGAQLLEVREHHRLVHAELHVRAEHLVELNTQEAALGSEWRARGAAERRGAAQRA